MQEDNKSNFYHLDNESDYEPDYNQHLSPKSLKPTAPNIESYKSIPNYSTESYVIPEDELENPNIETPYFKSPVSPLPLTKDSYKRSPSTKDKKTSKSPTSPSLPLAPHSNILYRKSYKNLPYKNNLLYRTPTVDFLNNKDNYSATTHISNEKFVFNKYKDMLDPQEQNALSSMLHRGYPEDIAVSFLNAARKSLIGNRLKDRPSYYKDLMNDDIKTFREK